MENSHMAARSFSLPGLGPSPSPRAIPIGVNSLRAATCKSDSSQNIVNEFTRKKTR